MAGEAAELIATQAASKRAGGGWVPVGHVTRERALRCGGALERGDVTTPEPLAELGDALGGVGATKVPAEAAELVAEQAASKGESGGGCQQGSTRERALRCGSALERGDGAAPEPFAQLGDALGGVVAAATLVEAAEVAAPQAASKGEGRPQQAANRKAG